MSDKTAHRLFKLIGLINFTASKIDKLATSRVATERQADVSRRIAKYTMLISELAFEAQSESIECMEVEVITRTRKTTK